MAVYVIFLRESPLRDPESFAAYRKEVQGNPMDPNLKLLALYGAQHELEGKAPDGVVVLEFPTMEAAKAWYNSPGYQKAMPYRRKAADYRAFIVQGM
jgi:uncharacterized protein (DUF1330 family)